MAAVWPDSMMGPRQGSGNSDIIFGRRPQGVRDGRAGVFYDESGHVRYESGAGDDTLTYDPRRAHSDSPRGPYGYEFTRDTPRSSGRTYRSTDSQDERADDVYPPAVRVTEAYGPKYYKDRALYVEERIVSHERPWVWPLFLITGLLMLATGVFNYLTCVDHYFYSMMWGSLFVMIFAVVGAFHRGVYLHKSGGKSRNWAYIIVGVIAFAVVLFCCCVVQVRLNHVTIQITEHGTAGFVAYETDRMRVHSEYPRFNLSNSGLEANIWGCYSADWVALLLTCIAFAIVPSVVVIGNNYYNSNHSYTREVEPFCRPCLFNPYGQISASQALAFVGIVVKTATHGNFRVRYQDYWVPIWIIVFPALAGAFAAIALKRIGLRKGRSVLTAAIILELLAFLAMAGTLGLNTFAMYENILSLNPGPIATTDYSTQLLTSSIVLYAVLDIMLLVGLIYALALFIRLIMEGCHRDNNPDDQRRRVEDDRYATRYPDEVRVGTKVEQEVLGPARGYAEDFRPYRPEFAQRY